MYLPLYPKGMLYHPVALLFGTAPALYGPWNWTDLSGGDLPAGKKTHIVCAILYQQLSFYQDRLGTHISTGKG